ncbi:MAG: WD40 repeat domain-containing protein, partial [Actinobacteria bacterium]|nr:WD40 repeat domain-containing protein [Actinomycetota bacterium]
EQDRVECAALIELAGACIAEPVLVIKGHQGRVKCLAATPEGSLLASVGSNGTVRLWRLPSGEPADILKVSVSWLAVSACGTLLAGDTFRREYQQTVERLERTWADPEGYWYSVEETRSYLMLGLWQLPSGELVDELSVHSEVECMTVTPDGRPLVAGVDEYWSVEESDVRSRAFWRLQPQERLCTFDGHTGKVFSLAVTLDGALLASGSADGTIRLWQVPSGKLCRTFNGHSGKVSCLAVSPDGRFLASGSRKETAVQIWRLPSGELVDTLHGHTGGVLSLTFSPDGALLASGSRDGTIRLWPWTLRLLVRKPLDEVSLTEIERLRQSSGDRSTVARAWIDLTNLRG